MTNIYKLDDFGDVLTVEEMRKVLRIGRNQAYAMLKNGKIKSIQVANKYLIPKYCILDYLHTAA